MARIYSASVVGVSVSTFPQDFFGILAPANKDFVIHECRINQDSSTTSAQIRVRVSKLTPTVTAGSGGTTPAAVKKETGDAASGATLWANATTQATTSGSKTAWKSDAFNVLVGWIDTPAPEDRLKLAGTEGAVVELLAGSSLTAMDGTLIWEEAG